MSTTTRASSRAGSSPDGLETDGAASEVDVAELAAQLRIDSIEAAAGVGSGHVTSSLSAADLMAVLLADHLRYDWQRPEDPDNDHLIFSKGHASPLLYAMFRAAGAIDEDELRSTYRRLGSRLEGHPTPRLPWVDVATGSLGQGLPIGVGIAAAARRLTGRPGRVWVLCGDSEMSEGSVWEALDMAGRWRLDNLTVIVDVNRLGQSGPTAWGWDMQVYADRVQAFGAVPYVVDGHNAAEIDAAYRFAASSDAPTVVLARTVKGRGVPEIENREGWHGKALDPDMTARAVKALGGRRDIRVAGHAPARPVGQTRDAPREVSSLMSVTMPRYEIGQQVATRAAYGAALGALGERGDIVALDGEVANSTHAQDFADRFPERFFQAYIAECQMVATAIAVDKAGYRPFASTFAAFVSRAYDFIRMAAVSRANIVICGSHAGVEIGADGPSQMALEDIAALRAVHASTVLYPSDATSCARLTQAAADTDGIVYLRTTRGAYPVLYGPDETFPVGGSKTVRHSNRDQVTIVAAGVTVHTALAAADRLSDEGVGVRVIDAYSVKPIDAAAIRKAAAETFGRVIVVEDHHPEGGLCSAVLEAFTGRADGDEVPGGLGGLAVESLAVRNMPASATPAEQLAAAGLDADAIVGAVHRLLPESAPRRSKTEMTQ